MKFVEKDDKWHLADLETRSLRPKFCTATLKSTGPHFCWSTFSRSVSFLNQKQTVGSVPVDSGIHNTSAQTAVTATVKLSNGALLLLCCFQRYLPRGSSPSSLLQRTVGVGSPCTSQKNSTVSSASTTWFTGCLVNAGLSEMSGEMYGMERIENPSDATDGKRWPSKGQWSKKSTETGVVMKQKGSSGPGGWEGEVCCENVRESW